MAIRQSRANEAVLFVDATNMNNDGIYSQLYGKIADGAEIILAFHGGVASENTNQHRLSIRGDAKMYTADMLRLLSSCTDDPVNVILRSCLSGAVSTKDISMLPACSTLVTTTAQVMSTTGRGLPSGYQINEGSFDDQNDAEGN